MACLGRKNLQQAFEIAIAKEQVDENLFNFRFYDQKDIDKFNEDVKRLRIFKHAASNKPDKTTESRFSKAVEKIKNDLNWKYKYEASPLLPAKRTVSELSYANDEFKRMDYSKALERKPKVVIADAAETTDGRLLGSAAHLLISNLDITKPINTESVEQTRQNLIAQQAISPTIAKRLDANLILAFFDSELGRLAMDNANTVWREWPFTFTIPADQLHFLEETEVQVTAAGETIIVQGIIDMLIKTGSGLVVIDFKTDNVTERQAVKRAESYKRQLDLYAQAAFAVLKIPVASKWLYFLKPAQSVQIR